MSTDAPDPPAQRPEDLERLLCFDIYAAHQAFGRLYKEFLAPLGLTYSQYLVLLLLDTSRPRSVGEIGQALGLESNTLTPLLKRMQHAGLVTRLRDPEDERRVVVRLTEAGTALRSEAREVPRHVASAVGLPQSELQNLQTRLRDLTRHLDVASTGKIGT